MSMIKWQPFHAFEDLLNDHPFHIFRSDISIDVYEQGNNVIAQINLPGIKPDDIDVTIEDEHLRIKGRRHEEKEINHKNYYHKEIRRGSFDRVVTLPRSVNKDGVSAHMHDGVLVITMPKIAKGEGQTKRIKITQNIHN